MEPGDHNNQESEFFAGLEQGATFPAACVGLRAFIPRGGFLCSLGIGRIAWQPGINVAYCEFHLAPEAECSCGFYLGHQMEDLGQLYSSALIYAACVCRGEVLVHREGFRAQEAQIVALAIDSERTSDEVVRQAPEIARRYGVPLVEVKDLDRVAAGYGQAPERPQKTRDRVSPEEAYRRRADQVAKARKKKADLQTERSLIAAFAGAAILGTPAALLYSQKLITASAFAVPVIWTALLLALAAYLRGVSLGSSRPAPEGRPLWVEAFKLLAVSIPMLVLAGFLLAMAADWVIAIMACLLYGAYLVLIVLSSCLLERLKTET